MVAGGLLYVVLFVVGLVMAVAWVVLPFAVIGVKPLLKDLIAEMRKTNSLLERSLARPSSGQVAPLPSQQIAPSSQAQVVPVYEYSRAIENTDIWICPRCNGVNDRSDPTCTGCPAE